MRPICAATSQGVIPFGGVADGAKRRPTCRSLDAADLPAAVETVFLCETQTFPRLQMRRRLPARIEVVEPGILAEIARDVVPARAWTPIERHIYPIDIPEISLPPGKDLILMDCPARNLALMPNGLAYVNNALKKSNVSFAVFDLDIVTYHRFHVRRLFDEGGRVVLGSGRVLPLDPWQAEHYDLWNEPEVIDYFMPIIVEAADAIVAARPHILGLSVQQCSEAYSRRLVNLVRERHPDVVVVVGGFSCYNADIGLKGFPEADYMCIGEADLTVGPLMEALAAGERPHNQAGVVSRFDDPKIPFIPAPMPHDLSSLEPPKYEWFDISFYRNFNGYQLTPIIASRGCRWSRCTFCAERFYWRIRDPKEFADEIELLSSQGCTLFMFNESDLNGMPEKVLEICDEIIRRNLNVKLTGQLRIHKKSDRAYFQKLHQAGFVALRFGVDAFSENTLRLQKKGYTPKMVSQNLRDCWEAGIFTEVNWVIGVPGETEADCDEGIALILANAKYIGRLANINPLILVNGGVYWLDPEGHNIVFREPKEQLYERNPRVIPADLWYSTEPYIDAQVRKERFDRIVLALHDAGFPVGEWAARVIEDVKYARDRNRAGGAKSSAKSTARPGAESAAQAQCRRRASGGEGRSLTAPAQAAVAAAPDQPGVVGTELPRPGARAPDPQRRLLPGALLRPAEGARRHRPRPRRCERAPRRRHRHGRERRGRRARARRQMGRLARPFRRAGEAEGRRQLLQGWQRARRRSPGGAGRAAGDLAVRRTGLRGEPRRSRAAPSCRAPSATACAAAPTTASPRRATGATAWHRAFNRLPPAAPAPPSAARHHLPSARSMPQEAGAPLHRGAPISPRLALRGLYRRGIGRADSARSSGDRSRRAPVSAFPAAISSSTTS